MSHLRAAATATRQPGDSPVGHGVDLTHRGTIVAILLHPAATARLHRPPTLPGAVVELHASRRLARRDHRSQQLARLRALLAVTGRHPKE
jgi:hypothetical protein